MTSYRIAFVLVLSLVLLVFLLVLLLLLLVGVVGLDCCSGALLQCLAYASVSHSGPVYTTRVSASRIIYLILL